MARTLKHRDLAPILAAARTWIDECLTEDGSVFSSDSLWAADTIAQVRRAVVEHPDAGKDDFVTKLSGQMSAASPEAQKLTAEMLWSLFLFPSNMKPATKRDQIQRVWGLCGLELADTHPQLDDSVLVGIGSGGPGFASHRWRELAFLIELAGALKGEAGSVRRRVLTDYDAFVEWIPSVPEKGHRQFRHMLRYFAFPDRVERMSSNRDRSDILAAFKVAPQKTTQAWSDRQLDDELGTLRSQLEAECPGEVLDFYELPLSARWSRSGGEPPGSGDDNGAPPPSPQPQSTHLRPTNLILYGPPGTGKTWWLQKKFADYTDSPIAVDAGTWRYELVSNHGWRSVIASALSQLGSSAHVPEIRDHEWVQANARQRSLTNTALQALIWGYLQRHTPESVTTVRMRLRSPPFVFSKRDDSSWELLTNWRELDEEASELLGHLQAGPRATERPVKRYRVVTFHPSFSYEDFVRGIRPVTTDEEGATQFRSVDGIFKQICDEARANPSKRYALFIDEINRANIAKVFGELITLIEPDKRAVYDEHGALKEGMVVQLPGGEEVDVAEPPFGVPSNLDIYGSMNTADRSIALLDVALRRRFRFLEMEPEYGVLDRLIESVHLGRLLRRINDRLEYLLDRDHRIGHAYLLSVGTLADLRAVFRDQVVPLLQEYFFDDFARVAIVLATSASAPPFVSRERFTFDELFAGMPPEVLPPERVRHQVTSDLTWTAASFCGMYE